MPKADLHIHTCFSHGQNTPLEMHLAGKKKKLAIMGFSEHSPRPLGFDYSNEYRERLNRHLHDYVNQVENLKASPSSCRVLLGMEMDWLRGQEDFTSRACRAFDFDYLIGSVHFLDHWGFDDSSDPWLAASQEQCEKWYVEYFTAWRQMLASGLFQIAAHPDLIKIFSVDQFHIWLARPESLRLVREGLRVLAEKGMAMEVSSAGLRKPCGEIYPCAPIMALAREMDVPISISSDAHCAADVAHAYPRLASYARAFGYHEQMVYEHGRATPLPF